jgi:16S rRNA (cytidine1402-2'-O)-methyltransferase
MAIVYLIPAPLADEVTEVIPPYVLTAIQACNVLFVENERSARRYLKKMDRSIVIDSFQWVTIHKAEKEVKQLFKQAILDQKTIGIISEAGCPGIADPGQVLTDTAHALGATVKPLVGPSSILLALMASGFSGQQFAFQGYLPIETPNRSRRLKQLEDYSAKSQSTQIFIETPYRNNQMLETILKSCLPSTKLCIAVDLTAATEWIQTKTIKEWRASTTDLHKRPAIFLLYAGN